MGFYNNIQRSRRVTVLAKLYCILLFIIVSLAPIFGMLLKCNFNPKGLYFFDIAAVFCFKLEHFTYTISCLYTSQASFHRYCLGIKTIDRTLGLRTPLKSPFIFILYFHILLKFLHVIQLVVTLPSQWIAHVTVGLLVIFNTMIFATTIITYNLFFERMKLIRKLLSRHLNDFDKINVVQKYLLSYKHLLYNLQNNNRAVTFTYFVNILTNFFKVTYYTYFMVDLILNKKFNDLEVYILSYNIIVSICLLVPGVFCELAKAEYEKIQLSLAYELLQCKDDQLRMALYKAIEYLEERPPSVSIYRLFPVDNSLITNFLHVCITYIIVLLQTVF